MRIDQERGRMRALVSVYDKTGVEALAKGLIALGYDYEQRTRARKPPEYWPTLPARAPGR